MKILILVLFTLVMSLGQLLFKKASMEINWSGGLLELFNPWLIVAITLYAGATLVWVWILRTVPLNFAYPFTALAFVIVPVAASYIFKESLGWPNVVGTVLIMAGIAVISLKEI
ncbi:EamA family transporter [Kiloniella laminariae]|uniref:EamA family transporter n=1 Tax=Kiloniella laminariae TaxID=454162 RepID=A0ABT4LIK3_9PROT|nr:EamA family transporter [Kiloniella laminariae]MCZ4280907.1 EamA family transporter [Kiloniella laminariae]